MEVLGVFEEGVKALVHDAHDFFRKFCSDPCLPLAEIEQLSKSGADREVKYIDIGGVGLRRFECPERPNKRLDDADILK